jgi:hypothetical protein
MNQSDPTTTWDLFASQDDDGIFHDIFPSKRQVLNCADNAVPVRVELIKATEQGTHWGWLDNSGSISMMFDSKRTLELCFPYGLEDATKRGEGHAVELKVSLRII